MRFHLCARGLALSTIVTTSCLVGCGGSSVTANTADAGFRMGGFDAMSRPVELPAASCEQGGSGTDVVAPPVLAASLSDRWHEGWLASPIVRDLDGDGTVEIVLARAEKLIAYHFDGSVQWNYDFEGRAWASPVVGDLLGNHTGLEIAFAARDEIHLIGSDGMSLPNFPVTWRDEMRSLAAADIDGDGLLELVAVTTQPLEASAQRDVVVAFEMDGSIVSGFPPNTSGSSGCDDACYVTGGYDQNLALGDVNDDSIADVLVTQDNAYNSLHEGSGRAFDCSPIFEDRTKFSGVRFLLDYAEARQGWSPSEETSLQGHFTNSAPAITDVDGDGIHDIVLLGSVQNTSQTDRYRGVALWAVRNDGTRLPGWETPFHAPNYLAGLWDFDGVNIVAATNQVSVAELFPDRAGPEFVFAGFDGTIHCVDARAAEIWSYAYTTSPRVLTTGVAVADLSRDGRPEIVFATYSPDIGASHLFILDAGGNLLFREPLPHQGAMSVPTLADANLDGTLEIVVALKGGQDDTPQGLVFSIAGSGENCLMWPTGRGNDLRTGSVDFAED